MNALKKLLKSKEKSSEQKMFELALTSAYGKEVKTGTTGYFDGKNLFDKDE